MHTRTRRIGNNYVRFAVTDNKVYALYSGKTYQMDKEHAFEGQTLLVYDWEGNLERSLLLDVPLVNVSYDREEQGIYGITSNGDLVKINCL